MSRPPEIRQGRSVAQPDVQILWATPAVVSASIRDANGVYDVRWTEMAGWSCTCQDAGTCAHQLAVKAVTGRSTAQADDTKQPEPVGVIEALVGPAPAAPDLGAF